jgi:predicted RecA/RadA family phage recombinase
MRNFRQPGNTVTVPAPAVTGAKSGDVVIVANLIGIATADALAGADLELALEGVYMLAKGAGPIGAGAQLWWDAGNAVVSTSGTAGLYPLGAACEGAADADTTVAVRLDGIAVAAVPGT